MMMRPADTTSFIIHHDDLSLLSLSSPSSSFIDYYYLYLFHHQLLLLHTVHSLSPTLSLRCYDVYDVRMQTADHHHQPNHNCLRIHTFNCAAHDHTR